MIKAYTPVKIKYVKDSGEESTRTIIPTTNVPQNIRAMDLSGLSEERQKEIESALNEYQQYVNLHLSKMFSINEWAEQTGTQIDDILWRTFKLKNTTVVE